MLVNYFCPPKFETVKYPEKKQATNPLFEVPYIDCSNTLFNWESDSDTTCRTIFQCKTQVSNSQPSCYVRIRSVLIVLNHSYKKNNLFIDLQFVQILDTLSTTNETLLAVDSINVLGFIAPSPLGGGYLTLPLSVSVCLTPAICQLLSNSTVLLSLDS